MRVRIPCCHANSLCCVVGREPLTLNPWLVSVSVPPHCYAHITSLSPSLSLFPTLFFLRARSVSLAVPLLLSSSLALSLALSRSASLSLERALPVSFSGSFFLSLSLARSAFPFLSLSLFSLVKISRGLKLGLVNFAVNEILQKQYKWLDGQSWRYLDIFEITLNLHYTHVHSIYMYVIYVGGILISLSNLKPSIGGILITFRYFRLQVFLALMPALFT
jgi:hypothetical protein